MSSKVDFSHEMFSVLAEGEKVEHPELIEGHLQFPLWDILKELDRRVRRSERDRSRDIRDYMVAHPSEVERVRKKHGL